jgi:predicted DNA binding CopG/RHH family protein
MKRLTLDISEPLHRAIRMKAVEEGTAMAYLLRNLLKTHYL